MNVVDAMWLKHTMENSLPPSPQNKNIQMVGGMMGFQVS